jgi:tetratricopeptide (TPR) repeat protein
MSNLLNAIRAPFDYLFGEFGLFTSSGEDHGRRQTMLYGLPAIIIAAVGCVLLLIAELTSGQTLEDRYVVFAEGTGALRKETLKQINQEVEMKKSSMGAGQTLDQIIPADDERRTTYRSALQEEEIYLKKLASLNTEEPEYMFRLAKIAFELGNPEKGNAIMRRLAPVDSPGYVDAHIFLAQGILARKVQNLEDLKLGVNQALNHLDQALIREPENVRAISIKAKLYQSTGQIAEARTQYERLFQFEPRVYSNLCDLNKSQQMADKNPDVLQNAVVRFDRQLTEGNLGLDKRINVLSYMVDCYLRLSDFSAAEALVDRTLQTYPDNASVKIWANRLLSISQFGRYHSIPGLNDNVLEKKIAYIAKSYELYPSNTKVLRELARLSGGRPKVRDAVIKIYDPSDDINAPAVVDNELGIAAMAKSEYDAALRHLARAVKKSPRNPEFLNNLAFANLEREEPNPERALKLIDQALRYIPPRSELDKFRSNFQDTKGSALMMLGQYNLAIGEFLKAATARPDNLEIARALRDCYKATEKEKQYNVWDERVQRLEEAAAKSPVEQNLDQQTPENPAGP